MLGVAAAISKSSRGLHWKNFISRTGRHLHRSTTVASSSPKEKKHPPLTKRLFKISYKYLRTASILVWGACTIHLLLHYVVSIRTTYGPSMLPTISHTGDSVLVSFWHRRGRGVKVGDLVTFAHPMHPIERTIKRIIGMPGDFVLRDTPGKGEGLMVQVPKGHCWVVGDNLPWSRDSRMYGPIPLGLVKGKVLVVFERGNIFRGKLVRNGLIDASEARIANALPPIDT